MKIAITGASGHVGINLCNTLLQAGHQVKALYHRNDKELKKIPVQLIKGDVLDKASIRSLLEDVEVVYHLAAKISIVGDKDGMVHRTNSEGTANLLDISREKGIRRFIHFSSIHAFQQHPLNERLDETRPLVKDKGFAYDCSKASGERAVREAVGKGLDAVILSPTAIVGPADPEPSLTGKAIVDLINHKIPSLVPGGYDWVDVRDVVDAAVAAIDKGRSGEKYLLSGHWHSLTDLASILEKESGRRIVRTVLPFWLARVGLPFIGLYSTLSQKEPLYTKESLVIISEGSRLTDHSKASKELGFQPRPFTETIRDMVAWLKYNHYIQ